MALLSKGSIRSQMGRIRAAARVYRDALRIAPAESSLPSGLRGPLARAREVVAEQAQALAEHLRGALSDLPLVLPGPAGFRVGNETREWKIGTAWVFDDTIEHEAWNDADATRVIMIFDIWNPLLSAAERELITALLTSHSEWLRG